ncbi:MAG TPA: hypothetical protein PKM51_08750 [Chitinophagales bacterium]|nr:hypothetical protein [Chitinophagales bacterium]
MKKEKFEKLNDDKFQKLEIDKMKEVKGGVNDNVYFYGSAGGSVRDTMIDGRVSIDNCC